MHELVGANSLLECLSDSHEKVVRVFDIKKHILAFELGKGLASIPDEILSLTFEIAEGKYRSYSYT